MIPHAKIRNALRKLWQWSPERHAAKRSARAFPGVYVCAECRCMRRDKEVDIDHVDPVGPTPGSRLGKETSWDEFMTRLFCPAEGLRVVCKSCHQKKTQAREAG